MLLRNKEIYQPSEQNNLLNHPQKMSYIIIEKTFKNVLSKINNNEITKLNINVLEILK